jgi:hypothetical protein
MNDSPRALFSPETSVTTLAALAVLASLGGACAASSSGDGHADVGPSERTTAPSGEANDGGSGDITPAELGCRGPLEQRPMEFAPAWGIPIAAFVRGAEEHVFFDSCRMVRLDRTGKQLGEENVCSDLSELAVAEDGEGYWLAGARQIRGGSRPAFELELSKLGAGGMPLLVRRLRTSGAFEKTAIAVSPKHLALSTIMASEVAFRGLLLVSKGGFESGSSDALTDVDLEPCFLFGPDRVRWTDRGFEGFCRQRRVVVGDDGAIVVDEAAPFHVGSPDACDQGEQTYFPRNTVFSEDGVRFVALEPPPGPCTTFQQAAVGTRFAVVARRTPTGELTRLAEIVRDEDGPWDAQLCRPSGREAAVVSLHADNRIELRRIPYSGVDEVPYVTTRSPRGRAHCPVPIVGGYLFATTEDEATTGTGPRVELRRLACKGATP